MLACSPIFSSPGEDILLKGAAGHSSLNIGAVVNIVEKYYSKIFTQHTHTQKDHTLISIYSHKPFHLAKQLSFQYIAFHFSGSNVYLYIVLNFFSERDKQESLQGRDG